MVNEYQLVNISKMIKGHSILSDINLKLEGGKIYGLIGENGSGKTMLLRIMSGLINPTSGCIKIDGKICNIAKKRNINIGVIIENVCLYQDMTALDNLRYLASINKIATQQDIYNILKAVGLDPNDKRKVRKYSLGMRQKLSIAQCFMENPDLILLDEPTNGLDAESTKKVLNLIKSSSERGAIILLVSHIKDDIFNICDTIYLMEKGKITEVIK